MSTINDETDEIKKYTDAMLSELTSEDLEKANSHHCKTWVLSKMAKEYIGVFSWFEETGLGLQTVDENTLRCIAVLDHELALRCLAMMKVSAKSVGVELETEGFTLLQRYRERKVEPVDDDDVQTPVGMEVA